MTALALILSAALIVALWRDRKRTRSHAAALLRRVRRQRDGYGAALDDMWDDHCETQVRANELEAELREYRREDVMREALRAAGTARLN